jgi:hypothetical protein
MIGRGKIYLDHAIMKANRGAGTAEPSDGGGEWLRGQEEADQRGTLSHLVLFPVGRPFFFTLVGSTEIGRNVSQNNDQQTVVSSAYEGGGGGRTLYYEVPWPNMSCDNSHVTHVRLHENMSCDIFSNTCVN